MVKIELEEQIYSLDKFSKEDETDMSMGTCAVLKPTFKECISLLFHAVERINSDSILESDPESSKVIQDIHERFTLELAYQNKMGWPQINIARNDFHKRLDIISINGNFIKSDNILTLLLRLLYIENYKRPYVYKTYAYHEITGHKISNLYSAPDLRELSLGAILYMLNEGIKHYVKVYHNKNNIEFQLGVAIYLQLK